MNGPHVVVGIDPDPAKTATPAWAADEARRRGLPLLLVHAWVAPTPLYGPAVPGIDWDDHLRHQGEQALGAARAFIEDYRPGLEVSTKLIEGETSWVLLEQSARQAELLVLGSWRPGENRRLFAVSSVTLPVLAHARCPVMVVRESPSPRSGSSFFVAGVDGSPGSMAAARVAFEEADLHGAALRLVHASNVPTLGVLDEQAAQREAEQVLADVVAAHSGDFPEVRVERNVVYGHPVRALTEAADGASGIVVGTRGYGGFAGMLLGSVSQGVLRHARCPVIAVPDIAGS